MEKNKKENLALSIELGTLIDITITWADEYC